MYAFILTERSNVKYTQQEAAEQAKRRLRVSMLVRGVSTTAEWQIFDIIGGSRAKFVRDLWGEGVGCCASAGCGGDEAALLHVVVLLSMWTRLINNRRENGKHRIAQPRRRDASVECRVWPIELNMCWWFTIRRKGWGRGPRSRCTISVLKY